MNCTIAEKSTASKDSESITSGINNNNCLGKAALELHRLLRCSFRPTATNRPNQRKKRTQATRAQQFRTAPTNTGRGAVIDVSKKPTGGSGYPKEMTPPAVQLNSINNRRISCAIGMRNAIVHVYLNLDGALIEQMICTRQYHKQLKTKYSNDRNKKGPANDGRALFLSPEIRFYTAPKAPIFST